MADTNGTNGHHTTPWGLRTFSALLDRLGLTSYRLGTMYGGQRQMADVLGYKRTLFYRDFKAAFLRQDLAQRLMKIYPEATWAHPPTVTEDNEDATDTPFEAAWAALAERLHIFATLQRADLLANLGRYCVLFVGLANQAQDLSQPARPVRSPEDVLYLEPYSEEWALISELQANPGSPDFGKPAYYQLNFSRGGDLLQLYGGPTVSLPVAQVRVHASRVIHLAADDLLDDEVYGVPWMEALYDRLQDLLKVVGGSAEMLWRDAKRRIALETQPDYVGNPANEAGVQDQIDEFMHQLRDWIGVEGVNVKELGGATQDPSKHFEILIDIICATRRIPKRIFLGSERGSLASEQDERNWKEAVSARQQTVAEPRYIRPLLDRLIALQALPTPAQDYRVDWGNLLALSAKDQAAIAKDYATALSLYAGPGMGTAIVPPGEFRETFLGLPEVPDVPVVDMTPGPAEA